MSLLEGLFYLMLVLFSPILRFLLTLEDTSQLSMIQEFVTVTHPLATVTDPPLKVQLAPELKLMNVSCPRLVVRQRSESPPDLDSTGVQQDIVQEPAREALEADDEARQGRNLGGSEGHTARGKGLSRWLSCLAHPFSPLTARKQRGTRGDERLHPPPPPALPGQGVRPGGLTEWATEEGGEVRKQSSRGRQGSSDVTLQEESEEGLDVVGGWEGDDDVTLSPLPQIIQRVDAFMRKCSHNKGPSGAPLATRVLDVSHLADNQPNHLAYALKRLARASPGIQHLNLKGFTALAQQQVFVAFLGLIRSLSSLWALNVEGVYFSAAQHKKLLLALSHSRISHMALPVCTREDQQGLLRVLGLNARRHSMWRLGGDPTQNNIILHVQGLWQDPADEAVNKEWLRENLSFARLQARQKRQ
jgi:hypothetical protein